MSTSKEQRFMQLLRNYTPTCVDLPQIVDKMQVGDVPVFGFVFDQHS